MGNRFSYLNSFVLKAKAPSNDIFMVGNYPASSALINLNIAKP